MPQPLELTGERTLPGVPGEEYWFTRHVAGYDWISDTVPVRGRRVVDAGSGEGYGAARLLAAGARTVVALELDPAASAHSNAAYADVATVRANLAVLPLTDECVDVLVSLQVVEHLWDLKGFLAECRRTLRPGGVLALTTPNRPVFSPGLGRGARPTNPFHVEEFDAEQLAGLVAAAGFCEVCVVGLHHGPRLQVWERANRTGVVAAQVALALGDRAAAGIEQLVAGCTVEDFVVSAPEGAQDLLLTTRRP